MQRQSAKCCACESQCRTSVAVNIPVSADVAGTGCAVPISSATLTRSTILTIPSTDISDIFSMSFQRRIPIPNLRCSLAPSLLTSSDMLSEGVSSGVSSHRRTVPSSLPLARVLPSGLNIIEKICPVCPGKAICIHPSVRPKNGFSDHDFHQVFVHLG